MVDCIQNACINTSCPSYFLYLSSQEVECTGIPIILNSGKPVWLPWGVECGGSETIWFRSKLPVVAQLLPKGISTIIPWGEWEFNVKQIEENQTMVLHNWCYIIVILREYNYVKLYSHLKYKINNLIWLISIEIWGLYTMMKHVWAYMICHTDKFIY